MTIKVGDRLPNSTFFVMTPEGPQEKTTGEFFDGRKVVLVGVPGAFTPTCHRNHLPGFVAEAARIKDKGVDAIAVTAVNDVFVLDAWAKASDAKGIVEFLADGNGTFAEAIGLSRDASARGQGKRSQRYSMIVTDGVVTALNIEPAPGQVDLSGAENLISQL